MPGKIYYKGLDIPSSIPLCTYYPRLPLPTKNGVASKFCANFYLCSLRKKLPTKNGVASKFCANFYLCSIRKKLPTKNGVASKFRENFYLCSIRKKLPTKNGVASKFCANVYLCGIGKNFLPKMELPQFFVQMFTCVVHIGKKTSYQKWSCLKFLSEHKIFLTPVYMVFKYSKRFRFAPSFNKLFDHYKAPGLIKKYLTDIK